MLQNSKPLRDQFKTSCEGWLWVATDQCLDTWEEG